MFGWYRKRLGVLLLLGGAALFARQVYLWQQTGGWTPYPLSLGLEWAVHAFGLLFSAVPFVADEGVLIIMSFRAADLPAAAFRFFETVPLTGFLAVAGYLLLRWERYLG